MLFSNKVSTLTINRGHFDQNPLAYDFSSKFVTNNIRPFLKAQHFALIQGFPGTGKSKVIGILVDLLVRCGKRVLLTAHTHNAVDNVMERILDRLPPSLQQRCVRLGESGRMSSSVQSRSEDAYFHLIKTGDEYKRRCQNALLVAGTCMGVARHDFFNHVRADYVIVDEAGQVPEPLVLGPLFHGDKFIMVGDPKQLPPLIKSRRGRDNEAGVSLMERLCKTYPRHLRQLTRQYRFNGPINELASSLTYNGAMIAHDSIRTRCLTDELGLSKWREPIKMAPWLRSTLDPNGAITLVSTSGRRGLEIKADSGYTNQVEIRLIKRIITGLSESVKLNKKSIGVIAPYRAQIKALQSALPDIMVDTVDKFQGKQNDVIIMSLVRSSAEKSETIKSDLLESLQRLNVAITRAKYKLIIG